MEIFSIAEFWKEAVTVVGLIAVFATAAIGRKHAAEAKQSAEAVKSFVITGQPISITEAQKFARHEDLEQLKVKVGEVEKRLGMLQTELADSRQAQVNAINTSAEKIHRRIDGQAELMSQTIQAMSAKIGELTGEVRAMNNNRRNA